jgi:hypothetical protein
MALSRVITEPVKRDERVRNPRREELLMKSMVQGIRSASRARSSTSLTAPSDRRVELADYLLRRESSTDTGIPITPDEAMRLSAVYSCVRVLSKTSRRFRSSSTSAAARQGARDGLLALGPARSAEPVADGLRVPRDAAGAPGVERELLRDQDDRPRRDVRELLPIPPTRMKVDAPEGLVAEVHDDVRRRDEEGRADGADVSSARAHAQRLHWLSPVGYQKETIGFGVALRKYGNRMFKNGANVGGVLNIRTS